MRLLVVIAGLSIGLSGCVGGGIVHRIPAANETADGSSDSDAGGETPPWTITQAGAGKGGGSGSSSFKGTDDAAKKDRGQDEDEDKGNGTENPPDPGDDSNSTLIDDLKDEAPTEGAAGAEELSESVGDTVDDSASDLPKEDSLEDPSIEDLEDTSITVPTKFPSVEPDLG